MLEVGVAEVLVGLLSFVALVLVPVGFLVVLVMVVRGAGGAQRRRSGTAPTPVWGPPPLHDPGTVEQRLAGLDDLLRRGVITAEEHREARLRLLAGG